MRLDQARFLTGAVADKLLRIAARYDDVQQRLKALRRETTSDRAALVSRQMELRRRARKKFQRADDMLFDAEGLEQATAEVVANHVSRRFRSSSSAADLTCGIGGDAVSLAQQTELIVSDRCPAKVLFCRHNVAVHGGTCLPVVADVTDWFPPGAAYFIDPSRRLNGRRIHRLEHAHPDLATIEKIHSQCRQLAIKASPALDYRRLPFDCEVEVIAVGGECREIMLWCGEFSTAATRATQLLPRVISFTGKEDERGEPGELKSYLYEVDKAISRAHLVASLAREHELYLVDSALSYLTGDELRRSPWLKAYRIEGVIPFSEKKVRRELRRRQVGVADVRCRGFVGTPEMWKKRLKGKGRNRCTLFLTRIERRPVAIFTLDVP